MLVLFQNLQWHFGKEYLVGIGLRKLKDQDLETVKWIYRQLSLELLL
jgi:hypothetical protein